MLDSAFKSLGDFFSKVFLGGYFFPALLAILLNVVIYLFGVTGIEAGLKLATEKLKLTDLAGTAGLLSIAAVTLAFLIAPFSGGLKAILAGRAPAQLWAWRVGRLQAVVETRKDDIRAAERIHGDFRSAAETLEKDLLAARAIGKALPDFTQTKHLDDAATAIAALEKELRSITGGDASGGLGRLAGLRDRVGETLGQTLRLNHATVDVADKRDTDPKAREVEALSMRLLDALQQMDRLASAQLSAATQALYGAFDPDNVQATRFGNYSAVMEAYPRRVYGLAYGYIAPRLDLALSADDGVYSVLDRARIEVESALTFLVLAVLSLLIWTVTLWWRQEHIVTLRIVALSLPIVTLFLHEFVVQAQQRFAERFVAVLDARRFDVMTALHLTLPGDVATERATWRAVQVMAGGSGSVNFPLTHPEPA